MVPSPPSSQTVNGYPRLASLIEARPECAIFRRFGALNAQNLLYLQAELIGLERSLHEQQKQDSESGHQYKTKYAQNWFWLSTSERDGNTEQLDLVLKARETLRQYSKSTFCCSPAISLSFSAFSFLLAFDPNPGQETGQLPYPMILVDTDKKPKPRKERKEKEVMA